ncbi:MAG TPA: DUF5680 domain-containing protein [Devosia sp.]|nr:DUF5680 domain-containing protein [Devosia sp.]
MSIDLAALEGFVVSAKQATYVGGGERAAASRQGSHDLVHSRGPWRYRDSYFGGTDFIGQEVVWFGDDPVWAMNYYGYITRPDLIDAAAAGTTIKAALSAMYAEDRFLGGYRWSGVHGTYTDRSEGSVAHFHGREVIAVDGVGAYALDYAGGLIKP